MDNNQTHNEIEQQIKQGLARGLNSGDFSGLKSAITDAANGVIKEASSQIVSDVKKATRGSAAYGYQKPHSNPAASQAYAQKLQEERARHNREVEARNEALRLQKEQQRAQQMNRQAARNASGNANALLPVKFNPVGQVSAPLCIAGGIAGLTLSAAAVVKGVIGLLIGGSGLFGVCLAGVFMAASVALMQAGFSKQSLLDKARRFAKICGNNMYAQINSIASSMGVKPSKVKKDIRKMLNKGFFPEGYLDDEETTLMLSDNVYKQYRQTKQYAITSAAAQTASDLASPSTDKAKSAREKLTSEELSELNDMINEGRDYIDKLHNFNKDIPGESITNKLNQLETVLKEIFTRVEEHPEQMKRMHKLMDYYLPTMLKLVEAYAEYDKVSSPGEDIINAKVEIENTLDTINEAFVQLLNNLFQDSVWDVTTDAQVLQTMLKQEGLTSLKASE